MSCIVFCWIVFVLYCCLLLVLFCCVMFCSGSPVLFWWGSVGVQLVSSWCSVCFYSVGLGCFVGVLFCVVGVLFIFCYFGLFRYVLLVFCSALFCSENVHSNLWLRKPHMYHWASNFHFREIFLPFWPKFSSSETLF